MSLIYVALILTAASTDIPLLPPPPQASQNQELSRTIREQVIQSVEDAAQQARDAAQATREQRQQVRDAEQHVREMQQGVREAQQRLREAQQQLREAQQQVRQATRADQRGAANQSLAGAQDGVREAEAAVREAEAQVREAEAQLRAMQRPGVQTIQLPPDMHRGIPPQAEEMAIGFFIMCVVIVIGWPIARALGRRIERPRARAPLESDMGDQLQRIEQAVEAMSIEVERISEAQRFMTKLQTGSLRQPIGGDR